MMIRKNIGLVLVLVLFVAFGCKKKVENKLIGDWTMIALSEEFLTQETTWTFTADNKLIQTIVKNGETTADTASYTLKVNMLGKREITIKDLHHLIYDGKYFVVKLNKSFLKIRRVEKPDGESAGAFMWREFQHK